MATSVTHYHRKLFEADGQTQVLNLDRVVTTQDFMAKGAAVREDEDFVEMQRKRLRTEMAQLVLTTICDGARYAVQVLPLEEHRWGGAGGNGSGTQDTVAYHKIRATAFVTPLSEVDHYEITPARQP